MITKNKYSAKLKVWSVEMPNAPYLNRYKKLYQHIAYHADCEKMEKKFYCCNFKIPNFLNCLHAVVTNVVQNNKKEYKIFKSKKNKQDVL